MNRMLLSLSMLSLVVACTPAAHTTADASSAAIGSAPATRTSMIALPGGEGGIGFDDLRYSSRLGRVLVPAGRTGNLDLVDPDSGAVEAIAGFGKKESFSGGHGDGTTSVDEGAGLLFAIDRTSKRVDVVDPVARTIVASAPLAGSPDYVRFVGGKNELWVSEPDSEQIEIFALGEARTAPPRQVAVISVPGGPESLVIDEKQQRAYTHLWASATWAIDLSTRAVVARWPNSCGGSRGIALDEARGFLFVGCAEGRALVLDVQHDGRELSSTPTGDGVDIIDYDPVRGHLYVPAAKSATLSILAVSSAGVLTQLASVPVAKGAHCATTDGRGHVFVGDPESGRLLVIADDFEAAGR
jgi:DNA-binding beta-propeller fold protein YncE